MAINVDIQPAVPVVNDDTKDAVVIDSLTKIFKKSRPLLRWHNKNAGQKEEKREVRAVDNVTITIKRREIDIQQDELRQIFAGDAPALGAIDDDAHKIAGPLEHKSKL